MLELFWKNNFLFGLIIIEMAFVIHSDKRKNAFIKLVVLWLAMLVLSTMCMELWVWNGNTISMYNISHNMIIRAILALLSVIAIWISFNIDIWKALYIMALSLVCQSIQFNVCMIFIICRLGDGVVFSNLTSIETCMEIVLVLISAVVSYLWFNKGERLNIQIKGANKFTVVNFFILIVLSDAANMMLFTLDENANSGSTLIVYRLYAVLFELVLLYMIYNQLAKKILEEEQKVLRVINIESEKQYEKQKSLMENISIKSHDLKKQINYLRNNSGEQSQFLDDLENTADEFFSYIDTKNHALSVVLTEKSTICHQKNIPINIMADGEGIGFMSDIDIYTLFANILDNSIEASEKISPEKRGIYLAVKKQEMMISIHVENYFSGDVSVIGDDFLTNKEDITEHGFGVKSIRKIVEKYDGNVIFTSSDELFVVNILIPIVAL
jgi:hypothetical protein